MYLIELTGPQLRGGRPEGGTLHTFVLDMPKLCKAPFWLLLGGTIQPHPSFLPA